MKPIYCKSRVVVLIDDDEIIHQIWNIHFSKLKHQLLSFRSINEFIENKDIVDKEAFIYIDSSLGEDIKGEVHSKMIHDLGFSNLYIETGFTEEDIEIPYWIKGISGKSPPEFLC